VNRTNSSIQCGAQHSRNPSSDEVVKVVPSGILVNPRNLGCIATSPTASVSGTTTTQSGTVQVIDLTKHTSAGAQVAKNGIGSGAVPNSSRSLLPQLPKELLLDADKSDVSSRVNRNGTSCVPTKGNYSVTVWI
jgi:hypothetical protein